MAKASEEALREKAKATEATFFFGKRAGELGHVWDVQQASTPVCFYVENKNVCFFLVCVFFFKKLF